MKSVLLGSFLAALAFFIWGAVFYTVLGVPGSVLKSTPSDVGPALLASFPENGTYFVPAMGNIEEAQELMTRGPVATVHIQREGLTPMDPMLMVGGFLHGWGYALLLAFLLKQICKKSGYGARVGFVTLVGLTAAFATRISDTIWWHKSMDWQLSELAYLTIGSIVIGLVLAKFIKSPVTSTRA
ncbi:hypothetical protein [Actomonas aquatica]|uniref:Uncharacterized protein n=1 Tax=Actomonas aquatica TaxID=2866162 RepID=A0ABZ1C6H2_9BACT|nr:hypothetical protein [Opitutus sp. WL0086]WRQ86988.1 hypothetical protein K1X11_019410 [Opitutus sp. WL0086]